MSNLSYSSDALDTLPKFHRKQFVIYVEGNDDVPFWDVIFQIFGIQNFIIKPAGGSEEIEKYTQSILREDAEVYVARDSDFKELLGSQDSHSRIVWTYGYSIENTLYHPISVAEIISTYARVQKYSYIQAGEWLMTFVNEFLALLVCDLGNEKYQKGVEVLGDKSAKFLQSKKSIFPSKELIKKQLDKIRPIFSDEEYSIVESLLCVTITHKPIFFLIRGHFLTNAVMNFIQHEVKKARNKEPSLSKDNLFSNLIAILKSQCMTNSSRPDLRFLRSQILPWLSS